MRRLSTVRALLVVAVSLVAGATTGVAGHALTRATPPPADAPSAAPSPAAAASRSAFLGAGNVLAAGDFAVLGRHDLVVDSEGNGEPQFAYACQREQLSATGYPTGIISATWSSPRTLSGAEVVAQLGNAPQTRSLFATLVRWHEHCTPGGAGPITRRSCSTASVRRTASPGSGGSRTSTSGTRRTSSWPVAATGSGWSTSTATVRHRTRRACAAWPGRPSTGSADRRGHAVHDPTQLIPEIVHLP